MSLPRKSSFNCSSHILADTWAEMPIDKKVANVMQTLILLQFKSERSLTEMYVCSFSGKTRYTVLNLNLIDPPTVRRTRT